MGPDPMTRTCARSLRLGTGHQLHKAVESAKRRLREFYAAQVKPYLASPRGTGSVLSSDASASDSFDDIRRALPPAMRQSLNDLESICTERCQLEHQRRLHHWLHFWLMVHVPLSYALTVLASVHIVGALRYR